MPQLLSAEVVLCMHKTTILCQFGLSCHQLTTISPSILNHFWWELYHSEHVNVLRGDQLRFKLKIDGDQLDALISYNQLVEYLGYHTDTGPLEDGLYRFKCITGHKGPYTSSDPAYNGSSYNLRIEWETGEQT